MNFVSKSARSALLCASVAVLVLAVAPSAFAHSELVSSVPAANEGTSSSPTELRLSFSEAVEPAFTKVAVAGPDKQPVELPAPTRTPQTARVVVGIDKPLEKGTFAVDWSVVSTDGHKSFGQLHVRREIGSLLDALLHASRFVHYTAGIQLFGLAAFQAALAPAGCGWLSTDQAAGSHGSVPSCFS